MLTVCIFAIAADATTSPPTVKHYINPEYLANTSRLVKINSDSNYENKNHAGVIYFGVPTGTLKYIYGIESQIGSTAYPLEPIEELGNWKNGVSALNWQVRLLFLLFINNTVLKNVFGSSFFFHFRLMSCI